MDTKTKIIRALEEKWMTQKEISDSLGLNKATVNVAVKKLVSQGLLLSRSTTRPSCPRKLEEYQTHSLLAQDLIVDRTKPIDELMFNVSCLGSKLNKVKDKMTDREVTELNEKMLYLLAQVQILENVN